MVEQKKHLKARLRKAKSRLLNIPAVQLLSLSTEASGNHDIAHMAAGVAYYAILSIFPLLLGLIALFAFLWPSLNLQDKLLNSVGDNIPGAADILKQNISGIIELRGAMGALSIIIFFWGAGSMFSAVSRSINRAWGINRYRHFLIRKARELGMVFGIGLLFLLSLGASAAISILGEVLNLPAADLIILDMASRLVAFLLILAVFLLLYKLIPNTRTYWRHAWPGALLAAVLFEIARALFIFYINHFANYQLIYGSIASIIVLLVWIYYSAFITILGAEFTFQYGRIHHTITARSSDDK